MKLFKRGRDGGPDSTVTGFWLIEWKHLFSVALLHFAPGSREAYHSPAFNSVSWVLKGLLREFHLGGEQVRHEPSFRPVLTYRNTFHKVVSDGHTYVLTFRGPWSKTWQEFLPAEKKFIALSNGRIVSACVIKDVTLRFKH